MSCYFPLKAVKIYNPDHLLNKSIPEFTYRVLKGRYDPNEVCKIPNGQFIPLPCGRCLDCKLKYSRMWADRCILEAQYHKENIFITLTYDNEHLPEPLPGSDIHSLKKEHLQKFFKDLRAKLWYDYTINHEKAKLYYNPKKGSKWRKCFKEDDPEGYKDYVDNIPHVRYYACGEYSPVHYNSDGSVSGQRPHFHAIIFGYSPSDLKLFKKDIKNHWLYYTSEEVSKLWTYGFHIITQVTWETCCYTARYILKKQLGYESKEYNEKNYIPEFTIMSRRPGIGNQFFVDHPEIIEKEFYIPTQNGSKTIRSNRYFDKQFDIHYPEYYTDVKEDRIYSQQLREFLKAENTSLTYNEQLKAECIDKSVRTKVLNRKEVL